MDITSCNKCGIVVDLKKVKEKNVYKVIKECRNWAYGFICPFCNCVNLTSWDYFYNTEEGKQEIIKQIGENYIQKNNE